MNSYRNQIYYIIVQISQNCLVEDSHFYGGIMTISDQKLIKMKISPEWWKLPKKEPFLKVINRDNYNEPTLRQG